MRTLLWSVLWLIAMAASTTAQTISANDNTRPAGQLTGDVLTLRLFAGIGLARPAGPQTSPIEVAAFGEEDGGLSTPGPLIRVRAGTTVLLTLRNTLADELRVHGLCQRPGPCEPVSLSASSSQEIRFNLEAPGTYFYWATTANEPGARAGEARLQTPLRTRSARDTQLGGAIIVDPREAAPADRVFVISTFGAPPPPPRVTSSPSDVFTINGLSWPHTERLRYKVGDRVRWRIINLSFTSHPMHLHGSYFAVEATGDIGTEHGLAPDQQRTSVTEYINVGHTFVMSWTPEEPGNWLFHCHMPPHMSAAEYNAHAGDASDHSSAGMAGIVLGIHVTGHRRIEPSADRAPRRVSMVMREEPNRYGNQNGYRIDLEGVDAPRIAPGAVPGPVLLLTRGEPVEITLVNRMSEPTAIHWHGIELESYYDGVPGWGGEPGKVAPPVDPGKSFVAKFTPRRAGTFIYHTHWHKDAQLSGGLLGPLIVLEPNEHYDPTTDHILMISLNGIMDSQPEPIVVNGSATPLPIVMRAGVPNRVRLINLTAYDNALTVSLHQDQFEQMMWKPIAKDGASLPPQQTAPVLARQRVTVGETYDFEFQPSHGQRLWLEVRRASGEWVAQTQITLR